MRHVISSKVVDFILALPPLFIWTKRLLCLRGLGLGWGMDQKCRDLAPDQILAPEGLSRPGYPQSFGFSVQKENVVHMTQ